jgi:hypothetical protein
VKAHLEGKNDLHIDKVKSWDSRVFVLMEAFGEIKLSELTED